jgi:hypothetical protein
MPPSAPEPWPSLENKIMRGITLGAVVTHTSTDTVTMVMPDGRTWLVCRTHYARAQARLDAGERPTAPAPR